MLLYVSRLLQHKRTAIGKKTMEDEEAAAEEAEEE